MAPLTVAAFFAGSEVQMVVGKELMKLLGASGKYEALRILCCLTASSDM